MCDSCQNPVLFNLLLNPIYSSPCVPSLHLTTSFQFFLAIPVDSELTFDYQWPPSQRPPTVCYCGTASCRGFLEVNTTNTVKTPKNKNNNNSNNYDDDDCDNNSSGFRRKGLWKSKNEFIEIMTEKNNKNDFKNEIKTETVQEEKTKMEMEIDGDSDGSDKIYKKDGIIIKEDDDIQNGKLTEKEDENNNVIKLTPIDPYSLVGRYVKVWWQSNLRFFEADVKEYSLKTGD